MEHLSTRPWRILMLYSNTGGGHRASAEALRQEFLRRQPQHQIFMEDILLQRSFWPLNESDRIYFWAVNRWPRVWKLIYRSVARPIVYTSLHKSLRPILGPKLKQVYAATQPDLVVSLHSLLNHLPLRTLRLWEARRGNRRVPFATVMTDLTTFHPSWVDPHADLLTVGTEEARATAIRLGISPAKVQLLGVPIRQAFARAAPDKPALRRTLGLQPERPVVLLMSGGQGMGPVEKIARAIDQTDIQAQIVVVTGRNEHLRTRLARRSWHVPITILGFVEDIHLWMKASDILVTKAGPGTIAEALICGLPMILYGYIPGQEEGNVAFVLDHQIGTYLSDPAAIAQQLTVWLKEEKPALLLMSTQARRLAHPEATARIIDALQNLVMRASGQISSTLTDHSWLHPKRQA